MNFTHKHVHTNGIRMHMVEAGEGFPVLLCHGFPELMITEGLSEKNAANFPRHSSVSPTGASHKKLWIVDCGLRKESFFICNLLTQTDCVRETTCHLYRSLFSNPHSAIANPQFLSIRNLQSFYFP